MQQVKVYQKVKILISDNGCIEKSITRRLNLNMMVIFGVILLNCGSDTYGVLSGNNLDLMTIFLSPQFHCGAESIPEMNWGDGRNNDRREPEFCSSLADDGRFSDQTELNGIVSPSEVESIYADAAITAVAFVATSQKAKSRTRRGGWRVLR